MAKMQESQLKVIEILSNPAVRQHFRANPCNILAAIVAADKDITNNTSKETNSRCISFDYACNLLLND